MRKTIALLLTMVLAAMTFTAYADDEIKVIMNGTEINFSAYDNVMPYIENDRTLVPIRAIAESMGFSVDWDDTTKTVTVEENSTEIKFVIESDKASVNGEEKTLDVPARITSDRTFVPLRFVSENMGATVEWNEADMLITITKNNGGQRGNQGGFGDGGQRGGSMVQSNDPEIQAVIDANNTKFSQLTFTDEKTGISLEYSFYVPENYDANTSYPLIMYIPDSTGAGKSAKEIVEQYYGANVWVTDEDQKEHPSFVLVPAFSETVVDDNWKVSEQVETAVNLIESLKEQYSIDENRLYTTGQSMGCMTSLYLNSKYPDMFAACLFVSGQWDISVLKGMETAQFFYITAGGDEKASGGQNEVMAMFDTDGIPYTYGEWDAQLSSEEQTANIEKLLAEKRDANMIRFETGTVLNGESGSEHMASFNYGYKLSAVRSWLFKQIKNK